MKRLLIIIAALILASQSPQAADWDFTINNTDTANGDDSYGHAGAANTNMGTQTTMLIGSNYNELAMFLRPKLALDSLAFYGGVFDSCLVKFIGTAAMEAGDTVSIKARTCRLPWIESEVTWNSYSTGNAWGTAGAKGGDDRYDDNPDSTIWNSDRTAAYPTLNSGNTGAVTPIVIKLPVANFGAGKDSSWVVHYSYIKGTEPRYLGLYTSDHTSAEGPIYTFYGHTGNEPSPVTSCSVDSLHNNFSDNQDSVMLIWTTAEEGTGDSVIIAVGTIKPDSSDGANRIAVVFEQDVTDTAFIVYSVTESDSLYASFWVKDNENGWSLRKMDSVYYNGGDTYAPDKYSLFKVVALVNVDPDSARLQIGTVDSADHARTIIRYGTSPPTDTTSGSSLYAGDVIETAVIDSPFVVNQPAWVYFGIFSLDENGLTDGPVIDSLFVPAGGVRDTCGYAAEFVDSLAAWFWSLQATDTVGSGGFWTELLADASSGGVGGISDALISVIMDSLRAIEPGDTVDGSLFGYWTAQIAFLSDTSWYGSEGGVAAHTVESLLAIVESDTLENTYWSLLLRSALEETADTTAILRMMLNNQFARLGNELNYVLNGNFEIDSVSGNTSPKYWSQRTGGTFTTSGINTSDLGGRWMYKMNAGSVDTLMIYQYIGILQPGLYEISAKIKDNSNKTWLFLDDAVSSPPTPSYHAWYDSVGSNITDPPSMETLSKLVSIKSTGGYYIVGIQMEVTNLTYPYTYVDNVTMRLLYRMDSVITLAKIDSMMKAERYARVDTDTTLDITSAGLIAGVSGLTATIIGKAAADSVFGKAMADTVAAKFMAYIGRITSQIYNFKTSQPELNICKNGGFELDSVSMISIPKNWRTGIITTSCGTITSPTLFSGRWAYKLQSQTAQNLYISYCLGWLPKGIYYMSGTMVKTGDPSMSARLTFMSGTVNDALTVVDSITIGSGATAAPYGKIIQVNTAGYYWIVPWMHGIVNGDYAIFDDLVLLPILNRNPVPADTTEAGNQVAGAATFDYDEIMAGIDSTANANPEHFGSTVNLDTTSILNLALNHPEAFYGAGYTSGTPIPVRYYVIDTLGTDSVLPNIRVVAKNTAGNPYWSGGTNAAGYMQFTANEGDTLIFCVISEPRYTFPSSCADTMVVGATTTVDTGKGYNSAQATLCRVKAYVYDVSRNPVRGATMYAKIKGDNVIDTTTGTILLSDQWKVSTKSGADGVVQLDLTSSAYLADNNQYEIQIVYPTGRKFYGWIGTIPDQNEYWIVEP